ncbi:MAG: SpoIIE family protein phosphatase [Victivallaceae bacterium]
MNTAQLFADVGFSQCQKHGQLICGDAFKYRKLPAENRLIAVLSDGLGSGIKANILSSMTAAMAMRFVSENTEIMRSAEIMMSALPICQVRKISYATYTIVDTAFNGKTRIIEMGNPPFVLVRNGKTLELPYQEIDSPKWENRTMRIYDFDITAQDRLIFFSDGISQAGMGSEDYPLGWRNAGCCEYLEQFLADDNEISAHELAENVIRQALQKEAKYLAGDDMTCAVMYFRQPRKMLLFTGPPFNPGRDAECAATFDGFDGDKVICGGTTAKIIARELKREIKMDLNSATCDLPPVSGMEGATLITEGIFTLTKTAQYLEAGISGARNCPAGQLVNILLKNDVVELLAGTRINEAHQDPNLPVDLEIRRNIVKRIAAVLKEKYLKEVIIKYV